MEMLEKVKQFQEQGVEFILPETCYVGDQVTIEPGVIIGPNTQLHGNTSIAAEVEIEGNVYIKNSVIGEKTLIRFSCRIDRVLIGTACIIGPFCHIRPAAYMGIRSSESQEEAIISVGDNAVLEAGLIIDKNAPSDSLLTSKVEHRVRFAWKNSSYK